MEAAAKPTRPRRGEQVELEVEALAQGGRGIARTDGYVVFVAGALPGDRVRASVGRAKRDYAEASAVELLRPSADRVPDRCVHDGDPCPGAAWQGLPYELQLEHKRTHVAAVLRVVCAVRPGEEFLFQPHLYLNENDAETQDE